MKIIPTKAVPSQTLTASLGNQTCQLAIYQRRTGLYMDVSVNNTLIIGGVLCHNLNRIVRSIYLGFSGDLSFIDNEGQSDPYYTDLGTRFSLAYLSASEVAALGG